MSRENGSVIGPVNTPTSSEAKGVWGLPQQYDAQRAGIWPPYVPQHQISRSLRFNSADSTYLTKTFGSSNTDKKKQTFSFWVKRTGFGTDQRFVNAYDGSSGYSAYFQFTSSNTFFYQFGNDPSYGFTTTQVFRDPSAWYHFVVAVDTTQATGSDRIKVYVNGSQVTSYTATFPSQNSQSQFFINGSSQNKIGTYFDASSEFFNGYLADFYFVDGQTLTPSSFGQTNSTTGVWEPIAYTGTYGTNGFYLNFSDNSGTAALGTDYSGNGNTWTVNNFSVTAGVGNDSLVDTPTPYGTDTGAGGEVRGNYATLNPLSIVANASLSNGNLDATNTSGSNYRTFVSTIAIPSGSWYCEFTAGANTSADNMFVGICPASAALSSTYIGSSATSYAYSSNGTKYNNASATSYGASFTNGDIIGVAFNGSTLTFYKNGVSQGNAFTSLSGDFVFALSLWGTAVCTANFGQRPFAYTAPSGFKALCTQNLPEPTVVQGDDYFNAVTYTGNSSNGRQITGVGFQPDFVWIKVRSTAGSHYVVDAVRGLGTGDSMRALDTTTDAEYTTENDQLRSFDADGFTLDNNVDATFYVNRSADTYVAWNWNAGGSTVTNTDGTISSQVRANPTAGFSIVSWTYGGAATIGHGLNAVPKMMIVKGRNAVYNWDVYHASLGATGRLVLNSTAAFATTSGPWNNTTPTSTVFSQGAAWYNNGDSLIGYIFAEIPGFSAFGSYTGNGSTDGPFVHLGFRPRYILVKNATTGSTQWVIQDTARMPYNAGNNANLLAANSAVAENDPSTLAGGTQCYADWVSSGFKIRANNGNWNTSSNTYIYMAFAENPFKYALAR